MTGHKVFDLRLLVLGVHPVKPTWGSGHCANGCRSVGVVPRFHCGTSIPDSMILSSVLSQPALLPGNLCLRWKAENSNWQMTVQSFGTSPMCLWKATIKSIELYPPDLYQNHKLYQDANEQEIVFPFATDPLPPPDFCSQRRCLSLAIFLFCGQVNWNW